MAKQYVKAVFLVPFYDKDIEGLIDIIDSISYYIKDSYVVVCVNDCKGNENERVLRKLFKSEKLINFVPQYQHDQSPNAYGSLWCNLYQGMEYSIKNLKFDYLLKMDTDALVTGAMLVKKIDEYFKKDRAIGLLGSYRIKADGGKRTRWRWTLYLLYLIFFKKQLSRKSRTWKVCLQKARENGYRLGESVLGGAYTFSYMCIDKMTKLYPYNKIKNDKLYLSGIGEDVIFGLLTYASDFKIGDFGRPEDPAAIAQKNLPISKENIMSFEKQVIHSVNKGIDGESEEVVRAFFKKLRS